jgi:hypothetical protein
MTTIDPKELMMLRDQMVEARKKAEALHNQSQDAGCDAAQAYDRFVNYSLYGDSPPHGPSVMLGAVAGYPIDPRKYNRNAGEY